MQNINIEGINTFFCKSRTLIQNMLHKMYRYVYKFIRSREVILSHSCCVSHQRLYIYIYFFFQFGLCPTQNVIQCFHSYTHLSNSYWTAGVRSQLWLPGAHSWLLRALAVGTSMGTDLTQRKPISHPCFIDRFITIFHVLAQTEDTHKSKASTS